MCECGPHVTMGGHQNQVVFPIPPHMDSYREARARAGLSGFIAIDRCLVGEIISLWRKGIKTAGCCCGHNQVDPMINCLTDEDRGKMLALGYQLIPGAPHDHCLYAKSVERINV